MLPEFVPDSDHDSIEIPVTSSSSTLPPIERHMKTLSNIVTDINHPDIYVRAMSEKYGQVHACLYCTTIVTNIHKQEA